MRPDCLAMLLLAAAITAEARDDAPLLTGEVYSRAAQDIFAPLTPNWRASISMMAPEGQQVAPGDIVVQFDGTDTQRQLDQHREQVRANEALAARDLARLEKEATQADFDVQLARVALDLAAMRAEVPRSLIGAIEYSENQLTRQRAENALADALNQLAQKQQSLQARRQQIALDRELSSLQERWWQELLQRLSIAATQSGFVIHSHHPWTRTKFQEGDAVRTSFQVAEVADTSDLAIRVWVNGVDRPHIEEGSAVRIRFDALPGRVLDGRLESLSQSAVKRLEWSTAAYFEGVVTFAPGDITGLLPGMSALVELP